MPASEPAAAQFILDLNLVVASSNPNPLDFLYIYNIIIAPHRPVADESRLPHAD
jgi:hypothetical protein